MFVNMLVIVSKPREEVRTTTFIKIMSEVFNILTYVNDNSIQGVNKKKKEQIFVKCLDVSSTSLCQYFKIKVCCYVLHKSKTIISIIKYLNNFCKKKIDSLPL